MNYEGTFQVKNSKRKKKILNLGDVKKIFEIVNIVFKLKTLFPLNSLWHVTVSRDMKSKLFFHFVRSNFSQQGRRTSRCS